MRAVLAAWGVVTLAIGLVTAGGAGTPVAGQVPVDACADVDTFVPMAGSTSARAAFTAWGPAICDATGAVAEYAATSSKEGRESLVAGSVPISLSTLPFTEEQGEALEEAERGVVQIPIIATAAVCTYWDLRNGEPVELRGKGFPDLRLSRLTIARLFGGVAISTDDLGLAEDNADNEDFPGARRFLNIPFFVRSGASGVSYEIGRWIAQDEEAEEAFAEEAEQRLPGAELPFEELPTVTASNPIALPEYSVMFSRMLQQVGGSEGNFLSIACMDNGNARSDARPDTPDVVEVVNRAWLENAVGEFVPPLDEPVTEAVEAMLPNGDGTFRPDPELESETAYPMPMVVYAGLATCGFDQATRDGMEAIVRYAIGDGQEAPSDGNVALPDELVETAARRLADWEGVAKVGECGEQPPPATSSTTTTTTTTQPTGSTDPVVTDPPYVDPGTGGGGGYDGGSGGGGGGGTGVIPDSGADVPLPAEETAAPPIDPGGAADLDAVEGPLGPVARVVAMARGSSAVPPLVLLVAGLALLVVGPVLQTGDALGRATSLPASARRWFRRLRP